MGIPLGAFEVGTGVTGLALGVAAPPVLGVFGCVGLVSASQERGR